MITPRNVINQRAAYAFFSKLFLYKEPLDIAALIAAIRIDSDKTTEHSPFKEAVHLRLFHLRLNHF